MEENEVLTLRYKLGEGFGLHARPAGLLAQTAGKFDSTNITVVKDGGNRASAKGLFALLGLKVEAGNNISIEISGDQANAAANAIDALCRNNLNMIAIEKPVSE